MNGKEILDEYIATYDASTPDDAHVAARRLRLLTFAKQVYNYIWNFRNWEWTYTEADVTVNAGDNFVALPEDFLELSDEGSVYNETTHRELKEKTRDFVKQIRRHSPTNGALYNVFAIWGGAFQLPYTSAEPQTLDLYYRRRADTFEDSDSTELIIPDKFRDTCIMPALVWRGEESKHDSRDTFGTQFQEGLAQMAAIESPVKSSTRKMPLANHGW